MTGRCSGHTRIVIWMLPVFFLLVTPAVAQFAGTYTLRGDELVSEGKYQEAIGMYDKAIALEPRMSTAWCGKGVALEGLGNYTGAIAALDVAISISPAYSKAWYEKGNTFYSLGWYDDSIAAYDRALVISPEYGYLAYYGKANAFSAQGRYSSALPLYERALLLEPGYAAAWAKKGDALAGLGDYPGAVSAYDKALSLDPRYLPAQKGRLAAESNLSITLAATLTERSTLVTIGETPATIPATLPPAEERRSPPALWGSLAGIAGALYLVSNRKIPR
ncbi:MAG: tetratricopeptide repeat protein [Methanoregulaceae archaeon]|nr:tetratricopeptide repeat protein [Methanoregulaceae archaeon]